MAYRQRPHSKENGQRSGYCQRKGDTRELNGNGKYNKH